MQFILDHKVTKSYLIYKWALATFLLANQVLSLTNFYVTSVGNRNKSSKYWIYATHWGFILITLAVCLDAILVFARYSIERVSQRKRNPHYEQCHPVLKISIACTAMAYPLALFVTLIFWSFLFDYNRDFQWSLAAYINFAVHLFQVPKYTYLKKTKCVKYPLSAFFAPQLLQNLAAIVTDLEAGNSKFASHAQRTLQAERSYHFFLRRNLLEELQFTLHMLF